MNCWEFKKCGREAGGPRDEELGVCPAYPNYGRDCARITGTTCDSTVQGLASLKLFYCVRCDFYWSEYHHRNYTLRTF